MILSSGDACRAAGAGAMRLLPLCILAAAVATAQNTAPRPAAPATVTAPSAPPAASPPAAAATSAPPAAAVASAPPPAASAGELMQAAMEKQRAAIAAQREAVRKQAESAGAWLAPWTPASMPAIEPPEPACDPIPDAVVAPVVEGAAKAQSLEPKLLRAIIEQESGYRACAISAKGAEGLMQLMPETSEQLGVSDPFDVKQNIEAGAKYLKGLLDKYKGDLAQALGAFNAGPAAADQAAGIPPIPETRDYVDAILKKVGK